MIAEIIKELNNREHLGIGEYVEIAKGRNELVYTLKDLKRKIKRLWHLKK